MSTIRSKPLYYNVSEFLKASTDINSFLKDFQIYKVLGKEGSASPTVIVFARYTGACKTLCINRDVVLKISFQYTNASKITEHILKLRSLDYEGLVYRQLLHSLTDKAKPDFIDYYNFVPYVTMLKFPYAGEELHFQGEVSVVKETIISLFNLYVQLMNSIGKPDAIEVLVTEKGREVAPIGATLTKLAKTDKLTDRHLKSYVFQTLVTLKKILESGIQHNDMKVENIMVEMDPDERYVYYEIRKQMYRIPVSLGKIMMFDWDNAHCAHCGENMYLKHICDQQGVCSKINVKYDSYTFINSVKFHLEDIGIGNSPLFKDFIAFTKRCVTGSMPEPAPAFQNSSRYSLIRMRKYDSEEGPKGWKELDAILMDAYFDDFKTK